MGFAKAKNAMTGDTLFTRRQQQLKFVVEERERSEAANFQRSRPLANDVRRSQDAQVLLEHFAKHREFWSSIVDLPMPTLLQQSSLQSASLSQASHSEPADGGIDVKTLETVGDFLKSLVGSVGRNLRSADKELGIVVLRGIAYLNHQLSKREMNYVGFRTVWLLLWPILNDFGLMPKDGKPLRIAIQKIIAKSF